MSKQISTIEELRELYETYTGKELEPAIGVSVRQMQNYLKEEGPSNPSKEVERNIREAYRKHKDGLPISKAVIEDVVVKNEYLEESVCNLTRSVEKAQDNIARLITLMEMQVSSGQQAKDPVPVPQVERQRKREDLSPNKRVQAGKR
jgi:hypothetical protein